MAYTAECQDFSGGAAAHPGYIWCHQFWAFSVFIWRICTLPSPCDLFFGTWYLFLPLPPCVLPLPRFNVFTLLLFTNVLIRTPSAEMTGWWDPRDTRKMMMLWVRAVPLP